MDTLFLKLLNEAGYFGHVLTRKLPKELDNRIYTLIHLVGGLTSKDVIDFANRATEEEIRYLYDIVRNFPSEQHEVIRYAGNYRMLVDSPEYREIIDTVKLGHRREPLQEHVKIDTEGFPTTDTNPYFTRYFNPKFKEKLFKLWDSLGKADYDSLKLFGVEESSGMPDYTDFRNVGDIVYPLLALEWVGGMENTKFAKADWKTSSEGGWYDLKFKVEPIGYDYIFDDAENYGEHGYACWHIRILIDKDGDFDPPSEREDGEVPYIQELFPESARNKLSRYANYTDDQYEVIEGLWEYYHAEASEYWSQFCQVEVVLV